LGYCVYGADFGDGVGALVLFAWRVLGALKQIYLINPSRHARCLGRRPGDHGFVGTL
jgi:hypothetical protein